MARIFISHSSADNFEAKAFHDWLVTEGWAADDIFLDLHDIGAGARWKEALAKANERCEAVVLLASPASLGSTECRLEIRMAEDYGKVVARELTEIYNDLAWNSLTSIVIDCKPTEPLPQALADAGKAVALAPHAIVDQEASLYLDAIVLDTRGQIYLALGRYDEAFADLDKSIAMGNHYRGAYYGRARCHEARGNREAAIADYQKVLEAKGGEFFGYYAQEYARNKLEKLGALAPAQEPGRK